MDNNEIVVGTPVQVSGEYSETRRVIRIILGRKLALIGMIIMAILILTAIFAPWLAPYDPYKVDLSNTLAQPGPQHLLGTDDAGRDTLSRIIYGCRTSLLVGIGAVVIAAFIGQSLGLIAAYFGGTTFAIIMRCIDALMSIPMLISALIIAALLGGGLRNVIIALGIGMLSAHCRMMCSQVLTLKQNDYVLRGKVMGASNLRMMLRHILPNAFPPLLVLITMDLGTAILAEAMLSFLGIGIMAPMAAWGSMVNDGYQHLISNPMLSFAPGMAIMLTVFGINMFGDGLRDALDPKLRGAF